MAKVTVPIRGYCIDCGCKLPDLMPIEMPYTDLWEPLTATLVVRCSRCKIAVRRRNGCNGNEGRKDKVRR